MNQYDYSYQLQEQRNAFSDFKLGGSIRNIPKAEFNLILGLSFLYFVDQLNCNSFNSGRMLINGLLAVYISLTYLKHKERQDAVVDKYFTIVGVSGYRDTGMRVDELGDQRIQKIVRNLTHPFFIKPKNQPQDNLGVIDNAVSLSIFRK